MAVNNQFFQGEFIAFFRFSMQSFKNGAYWMWETQVNLAHSFDRQWGFLNRFWNNWLRFGFNLLKIQLSDFSLKIFFACGILYNLNSSEIFMTNLGFRCALSWFQNCIPIWQIIFILFLIKFGCFQIFCFQFKIWSSYYDESISQFNWKM